MIRSSQALRRVVEGSAALRLLSMRGLGEGRDSRSSPGHRVRLRAHRRSPGRVGPSLRCPPRACGHRSVASGGEPCHTGTHVSRRRRQSSSSRECPRGDAPPERAGAGAQAARLGASWMAQTVTPLRAPKMAAAHLSDASTPNRIPDRLHHAHARAFGALPT